MSKTLCVHMEEICFSAADCGEKEKCIGNRTEEIIKGEGSPLLLLSGADSGTRFAFSSPPGKRIKVRLRPAVAGGARPRRI